MWGRIKRRTSSPGVLNTWLLLGTVLVVALSFLYYTFFFVRDNDKKQVASRFRVLTEIGEHFIAKEKTYRKIARSIFESANSGQFVGDTFLERLKAAMSGAPNIFRLGELAETDKKRFFVFDERSILETSSRRRESSLYAVYAEAGDLLNPLKRPGVLDELILLEDSADPGDQEQYNLYHTFPGSLHVPPGIIKDELKKTGESQMVSRKRIQGKTYTLFLQVLEPGEGRRWYFGGLIESSAFTREIRRIQPAMVIFIIAGFSLLFLGMPLLKVFLMSVYDQLNVNDVVGTFVSIACWLVFFIVLFLFFYQVTLDRTAVQENLEDLSGRVESSFIEELHSAWEQLHWYDTLECLQGYDLGCGDNFHDVLYSPATLKREEPAADCIEPVTDKIIPGIYRLFKVASWMDFSGQQVLQFFTRNHFGPLSNLGHREYFTRTGEWTLPGRPGTHFMLESIRSVTSGEKLAAISIKSNLKLRDHSAVNSGYFEAQAAAMTTRLSSVIDTVVTKNYGFCIIDKTGDVWFHSDSYRNLRENFVNETANDTGLLRVLQNPAAVHLTLDYHNKKHYCYIHPVPDIPLYIVTFHDTTVTGRTRNSGILYAVLFMLMLLVFNSLLLLSAGWLKRSPSRLKKKQVFFDWLRPRKENNRSYQHLAVFNLIFCGIMLVGGMFTYWWGTMVFCMTVIFLMFLYSFYCLRSTPGKTGGFPAAPVIKALKLRKTMEKMDYERSYGLFLLSWMIAVCVVPVILFYISAYNHEHKTVLVRDRQEHEQRVRNRSSEIDKFFSEKVLRNNGYESDNTGITDAINTRKSAGIYPVDIEKDKKRFRIFGLFSLVIFPLYVLLLMFGVYFLLRRAAGKVFGLGLDELIVESQEYSQALEKLKTVIEAGLDVFVFCPTHIELENCSLLFAGDRQKGQASITAETYYLDSSGTGPQMETGGKTLLIMDFDIAVSDSGDGLEKIKRLVGLAGKPDCQVIILTTTPLLKLTEFYIGQLVELEIEERSLQSRKKVPDSYVQEIWTKLSITRETLKMLRALSNRTVPFYVPPKTVAEKGKKSFMRIAEIQDEAVRQWITDEFAGLEYFESVQENLYCYYKDNKTTISRDDIILKIQALARHFYSRLLNTCSAQERLILYDIARDMLVNPDNRETIRVLLEKGLLVYNGAFHLMNESFRNYILSTVDAKELNQRIRAIHPHSWWKSFKFPLFLVVAGLLIFLAFQGNLLSDAEAAMTTAVAVLALLTKISGILDSFTRKGS